MLVTRHDDPVAFAREAQPFLMSHEAEHNLLLGLVGFPLAGKPIQGSGRPLLLTARDGDEVAGVATYVPPFKLALSRMPAAAAAAIATDPAMLAAAPPAVVGPPDAVLAAAAAWSAATGRPTAPGFEQRIYALDRVVPPRPGPGALRVATAADLALVHEWATGFVADAGLPHADPREVAERRVSAGEVHLWHVDGEPVSMASAGSPTPHGIRIGFVYTPPDARGQGHASRCVAALSQHLLDSGRRYCFLYTDLANPTSNRIYQAIGYRPVADVTERLLPPA